MSETSPDNSPGSSQRASNARDPVLVVGSWAKAEITVEHLVEHSAAPVYAFMDLANPGIIERADGYRVGRTKDADQVVGYAREIGAGLVLITTAGPLEAGVADALDEAGITTFAPHREAARLEWDKGFARHLLQDAMPEALPQFRVCDTAAEAREFAESLGWKVAIKPLGLTEGLGVRVWGDHLTTPEEVCGYIDEVSEGDTHPVLVEEKIEGEEFSIQALVHGEHLIPFPAVQDFKRLLPDDRGPNTAGMGSFAGPARMPEFLPDSAYDDGIDIMQRTLNAIAAEGIEGCTGFLYGQFMLTARGLKLIEYNFRPGDPEWMNTMTVLETPLDEAIAATLAGETLFPRMEQVATVTKYLVPGGYPVRSGLELDIEIPAEVRDDPEIATYHSAASTDDDTLDVGTERGIALVARGPDIPTAHERLERAVEVITGEFVHRPDIGSAQQLREKRDRVDDLRRARRRIRTARETDYLAIAEFARDCPPLEAYPVHQYRILLRYCADCSFVVESGDEIVAFELGLPSSTRPGTFFLWQIGVAPSQRGTGLSSRLLGHVELEARKLGFQRIELTVDPENEPSLRLFEGAGYENISVREGPPIEVAGHQAVPDHYGPGRHFVLLEKQLGS